MRVLEDDTYLILVDSNINIDDSFLDILKNKGMLGGYSSTTVSLLPRNGSDQDLRH